MTTIKVTTPQEERQYEVLDVQQCSPEAPVIVSVWLIQRTRAGQRRPRKSTATEQQFTQRIAERMREIRAQ